MEVHVHKNIDRNGRSSIVFISAVAFNGIDRINTCNVGNTEKERSRAIYTDKERPKETKGDKTESKSERWILWVNAISKTDKCQNVSDAARTQWNRLYNFRGFNRFVFRKWRPEGSTKCLVERFQCVITLQHRILSYLKAFCVRESLWALIIFRGSFFSGRPVDVRVQHTFETTRIQMLIYTMMMKTTKTLLKW